VGGDLSLRGEVPGGQRRVRGAAGRDEQAQDALAGQQRGQTEERDPPAVELGRPSRPGPTVGQLRDAQHGVLAGLERGGERAGWTVERHCAQRPGEEVAT
jgi:hypothetical protein